MVLIIFFIILYITNSTKIKISNLIFAQILLIWSYYAKLCYTNESYGDILVNTMELVKNCLFDHLDGHGMKFIENLLIVNE